VLSRAENHRHINGNQAGGAHTPDQSAAANGNELANHEERDENPSNSRTSSEDNEDTQGANPRGDQPDSENRRILRPRPEDAASDTTKRTKVKQSTPLARKISMRKVQRTRPEVIDLTGLDEVYDLTEEYVSYI